MAGYSKNGVTADKIALWILVIVVIGAYLPVAYVIEHGIISELF